MSQHAPSPPPRDRTPIYLALIAATATIIAAFIAVSPNVLDRFLAPAVPAVVVVTATTIPNPLAQITPATPTLPATAIGSLATRPPATPVPANAITFLLINNFELAQDLYMDDEFLVSINSGTYLPLLVPRGRRTFKNCLAGSDPSVADNCFVRTAEILVSPFFWEIGGNAPRAGDIVLLVLNQTRRAQDVFFDNALAGTVDGGSYLSVAVPSGAHLIQPCAVGTTPASGLGACGARKELDLTQPVHYYTILP